MWGEGRGAGGARRSKCQGISHIMASQAPYRASPGQPSSGHQATTPAHRSIHALTQPAYTSVDVLKLKNNYTATATVYLKVCGSKKKTKEEEKKRHYYEVCLSTAVSG